MNKTINIYETDIKLCKNEKFNECFKNNCQLIDCKIEEFETFINRQEIIDEKDEEVLIYVEHSIGETSYKYTLIPKLDLIDLIISIGNIVGIFFGINVETISKIMTLQFHYYFVKIFHFMKNNLINQM
jgi:hypothetical protein